MDGTTLAVQHWLKGIKEKGEIRSQFCHVIDVAPTALEVAGLPEPTIVNSVQQAPVTPRRRPGTPTDGVSINDLNCGLSPRAARKLPRIVLILLRNRVHVLRYSGSPASHTNIRSAPLRGRLDPQFPS